MLSDEGDDAMGDGALTIVVVDDNDDLRSIYALCLRRAGYAVVEASDGLEALEVVRSQRPSLMLLDLWMPGLNGFEVLDRLRGEPNAALMKVMILSCVADADARLECFGAGADDYLVKGLTLAELLGHVRRALTEDLNHAWAASENEPPTSMV